MLGDEATCDPAVEIDPHLLRRATEIETCRLRVKTVAAALHGSCACRQAVKGPAAVLTGVDGVATIEPPSLFVKPAFVNEPSARRFICDNDAVVNHSIAVGVPRGVIGPDSPAVIGLLVIPPAGVPFKAVGQPVNVGSLPANGRGRCVGVVRPATLRGIVDVDILVGQNVYIGARGCEPLDAAVRTVLVVEVPQLDDPLDGALRPKEI